MNQDAEWNANLTTGQIGFRYKSCQSSGVDTDTMDEFMDTLMNMRLLLDMKFAELRTESKLTAVPKQNQTIKDNFSI